MPETYQTYRTWEVALQAADNLETDRVQSGDIVAVRLPLPYIGKKEFAAFLWVPVTGLDDGDMERLADYLLENGVPQEKRRYCIPFDRLQEVMPSFDPIQASNRTQSYQPFQLYDHETGDKLAGNISPLGVQGLVFDKATMRYL